MVNNKRLNKKIVNSRGRNIDKIKSQHPKSLGTKTEIWENNKKEIVEIVSRTIEKNQAIRKIETDIKEIKKLLTEQKHQEEIKRNIRNTSFVFEK